MAALLAGAAGPGGALVCFWEAAQARAMVDSLGLEEACTLTVGVGVGAAVVAVEEGMASTPTAAAAEVGAASTTEVGAVTTTEEVGVWVGAAFLSSEAADLLLQQGPQPPLPPLWPAPGAAPWLSA